MINKIHFLHMKIKIINCFNIFSVFLLLEKQQPIALHSKTYIDRCRSGCGHYGGTDCGQELVQLWTWAGTNLLKQLCDLVGKEGREGGREGGRE